MYRKITLIAFLLFSFTAFSQGGSPDCLEFRNGKFKIIDPTTKKACYINRKDNSQVERMEDSENEFNFDIVWIDDCTYTITPSPSAIQQDSNLQKVGTLTVRITKTKDSSYVQRVTAVNNPKFRRIDEVFVIHEKKEKE